MEEYLPITTSELRFAIKLCLREQGDHIQFYDVSKDPMQVIDKNEILEKFKNYRKHDDFILRNEKMAFLNQVLLKENEKTEAGRNLNQTIEGQLDQSLDKFAKNGAVFNFLRHNNESPVLDGLFKRILSCDDTLSKQEFVNTCNKVGIEISPEVLKDYPEKQAVASAAVEKPEKKERINLKDYYQKRIEDLKSLEQEQKKPEPLNLKDYYRKRTEDLKNKQKIHEDVPPPKSK